MTSHEELTRWLHNTAAPPEIKNWLVAYKGALGGNYEVSYEQWELWVVELICDLFGVLLFGPAFVAAHRAFLEPQHPDPYSFAITHPPHAMRHRLLHSSLRLLHWNFPITTLAEGAVHAAETDLLNFMSEDPFSQWATVFSDDQLEIALDALAQHIGAGSAIGYTPPTPEDLGILVTRLSRGLPPLVEAVSEGGAPSFSRITAAQTLYAGWVFWLGKQRIPDAVPLTFLDTNKLCDHSLMQQRAVELALHGGVV